MRSRLIPSTSGGSFPSYDSIPGPEPPRRPTKDFMTDLQGLEGKATFFYWAVGGGPSWMSRVPEVLGLKVMGFRFQWVVSPQGLHPFTTR